MNLIDIAQAEELENTADAGVAASLGLNTQLFIFQLINFAIVASIIWFMILKPLTKKMAERKKIIDDSIDNVKKVEENLLQSEQKFKETLDEAKVAANAVIEKANAEAEKLSTDVKNKARTEIASLFEQAKIKIQAEKDEVMTGIKTETAGLIVMAVEKILKEKMDKKKDMEMVEETIHQIKI